MKRLLFGVNAGLFRTLPVFLMLAFTATGSAQSNLLAANKKYVRIDIGHGALHCPFLSPKLETKLKAISGVGDFFIDKEKSYATFTLPSDTQMTVETLKKIGTEVGYPADDVIVKLDTKPIVVASDK